MSAIPVAYRETLSDDELMRRFYEEPIVPLAQGNRLFVGLLGVTRQENIASAARLEPDEWVRRLRSVVTARGEPALKAVGDTRDRRHIGIAWSEEGRAQAAAIRRWNLRRDRELAVVGIVPDESEPDE